MSTDPMEAYWDQEDQRIDELGKIAQEAGLVLPEVGDDEAGEESAQTQPTKSDTAGGEAIEPEGSKDLPPNESEEDAAVKALTEPKTKKFD